jgi:hypothetical protein
MMNEDARCFYPLLFMFVVSISNSILIKNDKNNDIDKLIPAALKSA